MEEIRTALHFLEDSVSSSEQSLYLGINTLGHDTAAAIVKDGQLLMAVEEERLTRKKHCSDFPIHAINACLKEANARVGDVDTICVSFVPSELARLRFLKHSYDYFPEANNLMLANMEPTRKILRHEEDIREQLDFQHDIFFCPHHLAHLASSYYCSPLEQSALLSMDGVGEYDTTVFGMGRENQMELFEESSTHFPHSIGLLYSAVTDYLGFRHHSDEGTVMGLAAYGNPEIFCRQFQQLVSLDRDGIFRLDVDFFSFPFEKGTKVSKRFIECFGNPRQPREPLTQRHKDIAAGVQYVTERLILYLADYLQRRTKEIHLCLSGGVALNCVANSLLLEQVQFKEIFIPPWPGDSGCAIGAPLYYFNDVLNRHVRQDPKHLFLGPEYSSDTIEKTVRGSGFPYRQSTDIAHDTASHLAQGKIVGWFQGRMEFGPRALGHRSILAPPFPLEMKNKVNDQVKHREPFRPFAPAVLKEEMSCYFTSEIDSPFMTFAVAAKEEQRDRIPAVLHVDETARLQTVEDDEDDMFFRLISEFKKLTGLGIVLNTSFNLAGEPMVCSPEDAIDCFARSRMDALAIGDYLVEKGGEE